MPHTIGIDRSDKSSHYRNLHQHLSDDENEDPSEHRNVVLPVHREAQKNGLIHKVHHHSSSSHHNSDHIHSLPSISHHPSHHSNSIHYQHPHVTYTGHNLGLLMLFDGIGLALITTATVLEGFDMWSELFSDHWSTNSFGLSCWLTGRTCQIIGLMFLIGKYIVIDTHINHLNVLIGIFAQVTPPVSKFSLISSDLACSC